MASILAGGIAGSALGQGAEAAGRPYRPAVAFAPAVVEWFSALNPAAGKHMVVYARFVNNNKPVAGARLTATLRLNGHTLKTVTGTVTGQRGIAQAAFTVPGAASGKTLRVVADLKYRGKIYSGRNDLKVRS